jgi:hypothetical protein
VKCWRGVRTYASRIRDIDTVDSELRLLVAVRRTAFELTGRWPDTPLIDDLREERLRAHLFSSRW